MPRLSIIIPHRHHDVRLEATILSILENRPQDSEIIVVHDGSYTDPYELSDEVIFVEHPAQRFTEAINAGSLAACSQVICPVMDGVEVGVDWAEEALELLQDDQTSVVAVPTQFAPNGGRALGISSKALESAALLQRGQCEVRQDASDVAAPLATCGFYKRSLWRSINGWYPAVDAASADVEMGWLLESLEVNCEVATSSLVQASAACGRSFDNASMKLLAELTVAYGVSTGGSASAMTDLLRGCLGGSVGLAVAWSTGIISGRSTASIRERLETAFANMDALRTPVLAYPQPEELTYRRAA